MERIRLDHIEVTIQIIAPPDKLNGKISKMKLEFEKAIATALDLSIERGDKFKINAYGWNFRPEENEGDTNGTH